MPGSGLAISWGFTLLPQHGASHTVGSYIYLFGFTAWVQEYTILQKLKDTGTN